MKKQASIKLTQYIEGYVPEKSLAAIGGCGSWLHVIADRAQVNKKLLSANFCKNRFCSMCSWRRACKDAMRLTVALLYVRYRLKKDVIFLTLTAPNVKAGELQAEINSYNLNFKKLLKRQEVMRVNKGYIRKLEITYNSDRDDYHPHFHVLMAVNKSYFTDDKYISHDDWLHLWQEVTGDESITQVDARKFKDNDVREIAKYAAKDSDYLYSQEVFNVFYGAVKGRQIVVTGGLFAEANKLYKAHELDDLRDLNTDAVEYVYKMLYKWGVDSYGLQGLTELTEDERREIMRQAINDVEDYEEQ